MCWDVNFYKKQSPESKQLIFKSDMLQNNPYRSDRGLNFIFYSCIGTFEYRRPLLFNVYTKHFVSPAKSAAELFEFTNMLMNRLDRLRTAVPDLHPVQGEEWEWVTWLSNLHLGNSTDLANKALWLCLCQHLSPAAYLKNEGELFQWLGMCFKQVKTNQLCQVRL